MSAIKLFKLAKSLSTKYSQYDPELGLSNLGKLFAAKNALQGIVMMLSQPETRRRLQAIEVPVTNTITFFNTVNQAITRDLANNTKRFGAAAANYLEDEQVRAKKNAWYSAIQDIEASVNGLEQLGQAQARKYYDTMRKNLDQITL